MSEKTVSDGAMRAVMDAAEEVIGQNGLKTLLNFAKLSFLIENRPEYGFQKLFTDEEYGRLIISFYNVLGVQGAKAVFRMIGRSIAKRTTGLGLYDQHKDLPPKEKLLKSVEMYIMVSGRGKALVEGNIIVYDNPGCTTCFGVTSDKPICTILSGFLDEMAIWAGLKDVRSFEKRCKAMGHETCRYEIDTAL